MPFETAVLPAAPAGHATPLLAVAVARGGLPASLGELDSATGGALGRLFEAGDFGGKRDETAVLYPTGPAARVLLVGMGKPEELDRAAIRRAASLAAKRARSLGVSRAAFYLPKEARGGVDAAQAAQAIAEGLAQGAWHFAELKRPPEDRKPPLDRVDLLVTDEREAAEQGHAVG
ncbi:MAG TPA: M17 family peptidase N-terminal domain-containing protein, partial [Gemmatimonadales bacterium]|nr:M17 family peptidase N-terminal domain-containing protein [Gemmatimonadales bacterium]